jgi:hypothetical protein
MPPVTAELATQHHLHYRWKVRAATAEAHDRPHYDEILATIDEAHRSAHCPAPVFKVTGVANAAILRKSKPASSSTPKKPPRPRRSPRGSFVCRAHQHGVRLLIDAEESWFQHTIDLSTT